MNKQEIKGRIVSAIPELRRYGDLLDEIVDYLDSEYKGLYSEFSRVVTQLNKTHQEKLDELLAKNQTLVEKLKVVREEIVAMRSEMEKLTAAPLGFGYFVQLNEDGTLDIMSSGKKLRVNISDTIDSSKLVPGQELLINEVLNVVAVLDFENRGDVVTFKELLDEGRARVEDHTDEEKVLFLSDRLFGRKLRPGDKLLADFRSGYLLEVLPKSDVEDLLLEEVPDISYSEIGGLTSQIEAIRDAVELPFLHGELFLEHQLKPPKGILLYGPPGCGKTLIAKAVANSLAKKIAAKSGSKEAKSYFINIKGPELLNKYVGETEKQIRAIFQRAKEKSDQGFPVIVFFDEMDSLFRTRGSGVSSDVENTIVPQLLAEIDGVESLTNVIVIGASNRQDMIDPAILRPGRLDVKIKIERPDKNGALDIFKIYLTPNLPFDETELKESGDIDSHIERLITKTVERMYLESEENRFLEVTYQNGEKENLYFKDFNSGAMIENIVSRAKKYAIKRYLLEDVKGIRLEDLISAIVDEFKENEDLPNTTNPDDWAKISGKKGERIVHIRTLVGGEANSKLKKIENVQPGQYL